MLWPVEPNKSFLKFETFNLGKIKFIPFTSAVSDDYYKDIKPAGSNRVTRCNGGNTGRYRRDLFHWRTIPWVSIIRNFVVEVLRFVFHKSIEDATQIMLNVHHNGVGLCGIFSYEVAETKIKTTEALARERGFPLKCTMERE
jgi:hypothetical protein